MLYNCSQMIPRPTPLAHRTTRCLLTVLRTARSVRRGMSPGCIITPLIQRSEGYTITEISLFLGITGLLFLFALVGTGSTLRTTRFTDSGQSLHAYLQKQYDNLLNGVDTRPGQEECNTGTVDTFAHQAPGTSPCLLLGKLVTLTQATSSTPSSNTIHTYDIVGTEPANPNFTLSDQNLIVTYQPRIVTSVGTDMFEIPWQAYMSGSKRPQPPGDNKAVDELALIRSPRSTHILMYTFKASDLAGSNDMTGVVSNAANIEIPSNFCVTSADRLVPTAEIKTTGGQGQDAFQLNFDAPGGDCNGT